MIFVDLHHNMATNAGINKHLKQILKTLHIFPQNMTSLGLLCTYCNVNHRCIYSSLSKLMGYKDILQISKTYRHLIQEKSAQEDNKIHDFYKSLSE